MRGWDGGRECGRVRKREPKLATLPKCPSSVTCAAAAESGRTSVARVTENEKGPGKAGKVREHRRRRTVILWLQVQGVWRCQNTTTHKSRNKYQI